jgi:hypothetical protein
MNASEFFQILHSHREDINALSTVMIAIFNGILGFFTISLARSTRLAAKHIPRVERAYIFGGPYRDGVSFSTTNVQMRLLFRNYGKTPALWKEFFGEFSKEEPLANTPKYGKGKCKLVIDDEITEAGKVYAPENLFISDSPEPIYFFGYVRYLDVFGEGHTTRFCHRVSSDKIYETAGHPAWRESD